MTNPAAWAADSKDFIFIINAFRYGAKHPLYNSSKPVKR